MKVEMYMTKIAASLFGILQSTLALISLTVVLACSAEKLPPLIVVLLELSWVCWILLVGCYLSLRFELMISECGIYVHGYIVLFVLRFVYYVLLVLFVAVIAIFVPGASQAKTLSDVMSMLIGPLFENALASTEIRLTPGHTRQVIGWTLLALLCYTMLQAIQLVLLLLCAIHNSSGTSTTTTAAPKADKKMTAAKKTGTAALLDV